MAGLKMWERNVRPRAEQEEDVEDEYDGFEDGVEQYPESESEDDPYAQSEPLQKHGIYGPSSDHEEEDGSEGDSRSENSEEDEEVQQQMSRTSFGALKQAHDALSKKRKRGSDTNGDQEEKLAALRSRLNDLRSKSENKQKRKSGNQASGKRTQNEDIEDFDPDSAPSEEEAPSKSRTSKHAPAAQSSKHQVTRRRNVIDVPKRTYRDPRFDALHNQPNNLQSNSEKAYAFLTDYQKSEIKDLRAAIKASKNEDEKEMLRRKMVSMENRLKSKAAQEREKEVLRKHRREEREKVEQGKQPFYLKRGDVKKRALEEKFKGMKGKEREKLIERRRKKEGQREKKKMPVARRVER